MRARRQLAAVFAALLLLRAAPAVGQVPAAAGVEPGADRRLLGMASVSDGFRDESLAASLSVPENVWQGIQRSGWQIQLAEFVVEAAPKLGGQYPRGWPQGSTWENTDAAHLPSSRLLVLAEKRRDRAGNVVASSRVGGVLRHELGHAFDMAAGGRHRFQSAGPAFLSVYQRDARGLSVEDRRRLSYYVQREAAGRQETFAEAFATLLGGGCDLENRESFERGFAGVLGFLRRAIDEYEPR